MKLLIALAVAVSIAFGAWPARAQFFGSGFIDGDANFPIPNLSICDWNIPTTFGNIWYIDPVNGFTQNQYLAGNWDGGGEPPLTTYGGASGQGTAAHPWGSLPAVFTTGVAGYPRPLLSTEFGGSPASPINPGDEILLNTGTAAQYGFINVGSPINSAYVVIAAAPGQTPVLSAMNIGGATRLAFIGIAVQELNTSGRQLVAVNGGSVNIFLDHLSLSSADYTTAGAWTQAQWNSISTNTAIGIGSGATCTSITNSHIFNVNNTVAMISHMTRFQNNEIDHFGQDALDFGGSNIVIRFNYLHDPINLGNGAHQDFIQGFSAYTTLLNNNHDVWVDSNTEIYQTDPNLPFTTGPTAINAGITDTDNQWAHFFITNNALAISPFPTAVNLGGCNDCLIAHNTVVNGQIRVTIAVPSVTTVGSRRNSNIIVKNNLSSAMVSTDSSVQMTNNVVAHDIGQNNFTFNGSNTGFVGSAGTYIGNNIIDSGGILTEITAYDPVNLIYNFHLLASGGACAAPACGFGSTVLPRPLVDMLGRSLNSPPDAGALAFP